VRGFLAQNPSLSAVFQQPKVVGDHPDEGVDPLPNRSQTTLKRGSAAPELVGDHPNEGSDPLLNWSVTTQKRG
jgi:hypothetical protein